MLKGEQMLPGAALQNEEDEEERFNWLEQKLGSESVLEAEQNSGLLAPTAASHPRDRSMAVPEAVLSCSLHIMFSSASRQQT